MLKVGVLCSKRAPGLDVLLAHAGVSYEVVCVVATHEGVAVDAQVPLIVHPIRDFKGRRREYDAATLGILDAFAADMVVLLGYCFILTDVFLDAFPERIFNVHDSDLSLHRPDGARRYVGLHSTRDAILAGEKETRSTLHVVTEELDGGPIIAVSHAYPVAPFVRDAAAAGHMDIVKAYAYAQREWMMRDCWGDMLVAALLDVEEAVA